MPRETSFRTPDLKSLAPVLVAALVAVVLRLPYLDWGLPAMEEEALPAKKAIQMWGFAEGRLQLDPHTAGWPALSFYAQLLLQHIQWLVGRIGGVYGDRLDYWLAWQLDPTPMIVWGRSLALALAAGAASLGAVAGRKVAGNAGAWVAGLLLAVSPLVTRHARLVGPDAWVLFFTALAVVALLNLAARGRTRDYLLAALWIGLGAGAKYTPALLALSLFLVHLERRHAEGRTLRLAGLDDRRLWLAALVCILSFALVTPYTLLDLTVLQRDVGIQTAHMGTGHFGQESGSGHLHYLNNVLPAALGWPAYLVGLAGLILGRWRREVRVLIWCLLPLLLVLGGLGTRFDRYMLPLLPVLAAGAGVLVATVAMRWPAVGRGPALAVVTVGLIALPLLASVRQVAQQGLPSTQAVAAQWLDRNAKGSTVSILTERYGPHLAPDPALAFRGDPVMESLDPARRALLLDRKFHPHQVVTMYSVMPEATAALYDIRHGLAYDYVVTSTAVRDRYLADPARFASQVRFYADLDRWVPEVFAAEPGAELRGPGIRIHRMGDEARRRVLDARGLPTGQELVDRQEGASASDYPAFLALVAHHAALAERWQVAVPYTEAVRDLGDEAGRPDATMRLAVARFHVGDVAGAEALFASLVEIPVQQVVALGYLGVIAEGRGDTAAAADLYRRVMELDPGGSAGDLARRRLAALTAAGTE